MKATKSENPREKFKNKVIKKIQESIKPFVFHMPSGKNIRTDLIYLFSKNCKLSGNDAETIAFSIEGIHTGSLLVDDMIDKDPVRRGIKAFWKIIGKKKTLSLSFLIFSRCLKAFHIQFPNYSIYLIKALEKLSLGESKKVTTKNHIAVCYEKTGILFVLCCILPNLLAGESYDRVKKAYFFGKYLGISYQLKDDYDDNDTKLKKEEIKVRYEKHLKKTYSYLNELDLNLESKIELELFIKQILR